MKKTLLALCLLTLTRLPAQDAALGAPLPAAAPMAIASEPKASADDLALFSALFTAIENDDYAAFVASGDAGFKELPQANFNSVSAQLAPKFKGEHEVTYLGVLKQKGFHITVWKISYKDGSDDMLASLSVRDGKVGGFLIR